MSDLTFIERARLEEQFAMGGGYVLDFSNRTFAEFVAESTGRDIYDGKYDYASGSKANRLRAFWTQEDNRIVSRLIKDMLEYSGPTSDSPQHLALYEECQRAAARLGAGAEVHDLDVIAARDDDESFELLATAVRAAIDANQPEIGLDRLHTYVTKLIRRLASRRGVDTDQKKALHAVFGEYVKALRRAGMIESDMAERILKSSISTFESFNWVRNDHSLAHDNPTLGYHESLLIFSYVCSTVRFVLSIEGSAAESAGPR